MALAARLTILSDARYDIQTVSALIDVLRHDGKKSIAKRIFRALLPVMGPAGTIVPRSAGSVVHPPCSAPSLMMCPAIWPREFLSCSRDAEQLLRRIAMRWAFPRVHGGVVAALALQLLTATTLWAQGTGTVRGQVVGSDDGRPLQGAQVIVDGTVMRATTNAAGEFIISGVAAGPHAVTARRIGYTPGTERVTVVADQTTTITLRLGESASQLEAVVVTALGETAAKRSLGTSQQTVLGSAIAETQRENFLNALQGRVAGVQVSSTSGVPGASSQIVIRGVSSISSSNQPLFVVDGLPMDNKTMHTSVLASSFGGSSVSFENRMVDFTNRGADINPQDIESITVLKGPEAAALYGIDAANGAIVITTKRGTSGGGFEYSNSMRVESV